MKNFLRFLILTLLISACQTYTEQEKEGFDKTIKHYLKKNNLSLQKTSSGLYKKHITTGNDRIIRYADSIRISYEGKLLNGTIFDKQTTPQTLAIRDLIAGWKEVLLGAREGDEWMIIIPPQLGYGQNKLDDIPVNSILIFKMKIVDVK